MAHCASRTLSSTCQVTTPTMQDGGRMGPESESKESTQNCRDIASGFTFREPGRYVSMKLKQPRKSALRACREFSHFALRN